jgi:transcriptional antiterminator RfaH
MKKWYVLHTKVNYERKVASTLLQRKIETYLPEMESGAPGQEKLHSLFPGYLFVQLNLKTANPAHWQWTPGLRRIVTYGKEPIPVPDEIISLIRRKLSEMATSKKRRVYDFKPGDPVRIKQGPFEDMQAVFDRESTPGKRVQVLLTVLNRSVRISLPGSDLEKVPATAGETSPKRPRRTRGRGRRIRSA